MGINLTQLAHQKAAEEIKIGDRVIDATMGNGNDTLFLANCVGDTGIVSAFDIQESALISTQKKLNDAGVKNVHLFLMGHEKMTTVLDKSWIKSTRGIFFNLGYLPNSNRQITTHTSTTLDALNSTKELLCPNGFISLIIYTQHDGGFKESEAINNWINQQVSDGNATLFKSGEHNTTKPWFAFIKFK